MADLPDPLTPPECDLRGLEYMPLLGAHLFGSEFNAKATDLEFRVAVTLWWAAWTQCPAASLPDDDAALCKFADLGRDLKTWRKVRERALHGFVKCSDGRLYHGTLAKQANIAWEKRVKDRERKASWRAQKERERAEQQSINPQDVPVMSRGTERGRDAENALNRRDGTGRDENKPKPTVNTLTSNPEPRTRETDPLPDDVNWTGELALNYVCSAAQWWPRSDTQRSQCIGIINGWLALGCSMKLILGGIGLALKRNASPTKSLARFDSTIRGMRRDELGGELPPTEVDVRGMTTGVAHRLAVGSA